jgi:hypothetical protein
MAALAGLPCLGDWLGRRSGQSLIAQRDRAQAGSSGRDYWIDVASAGPGQGPSRRCSGRGCRFSLARVRGGVGPEPAYVRFHVMTPLGGHWQRWLTRPARPKKGLLPADTASGSTVPPARLVQHLHETVPAVSCWFPPRLTLFGVAAGRAVVRGERRDDHHRIGAVASRWALLRHMRS